MLIRVAATQGALRSRRLANGCRPCARRSPKAVVDETAAPTPPFNLSAVLWKNGAPRTRDLVGHELVRRNNKKGEKLVFTLSRASRQFRQIEPTTCIDLPQHTLCVRSVGKCRIGSLPLREWGRRVSLMASTLPCSYSSGSVGAVPRKSSAGRRAFGPPPGHEERRRGGPRR